MKRVATAPFTVSQLIPGPQGDQGNPGSTGAVGPYIYMTKFLNDPIGTVYYNGKGSTHPYANITYYNGLWYRFTSTANNGQMTKTASSKVPSADTGSNGHWTVANNPAFIATEIIFSERGYIELLQSQSIKVMDESGQWAKMVIDATGITQYDYDEQGNKTAFLRIDRGTIGYYKADGTAIWQLGAAGVINIFGSSNNGWVPKSLYKLGTAATASTTAAKMTTSFVGTTYYQLTSKTSTNPKDLGYTQKSASLAGAAIDDGYYCSPGPPMETVKEVDDESSYYTRTILHYVSGYLTETLTVTWLKP